MAQSQIDSLLSVQRRPTQSSIEILSVTRQTNQVSISGIELSDSSGSRELSFHLPLGRSLMKAPAKPACGYLERRRPLADRLNMIEGPAAHAFRQVLATIPVPPLEVEAA